MSENIAAEQGIREEDAVRRGMDEKSKEFVEKYASLTSTHDRR